MLLSSIPETLALRFGEGMGVLAGALGLRRAEMERHLRMAFPDQTLAWRRRVARRCHRHFGREAVATIRLTRGGRREVGLRTEMTGLSSLTSAFQDGKGVVVASAHFGNWEMAGAAVAARGILVDVVARSQRNRLFDDDINTTRQRLGMKVLPRDTATKGVLKSLRKGRVVGLVADQDAGSDGLFVDFLGWPASTARGPAVFAIRTGAPLYLGLITRQPGFPQRYVSSFVPIEIERTGDRDADVEAMVRAYTQKLEEAVRRHPEQYFWYHRRWKTRPGGARVSRSPVEEPPSGADVLSEGTNTGVPEAGSSREPSME